MSTGINQPGQTKTTNGYCDTCGDMWVAGYDSNHPNCRRWESKSFSSFSASDAFLAATKANEEINRQHKIKEEKINHLLKQWAAENINKFLIKINDVASHGRFQVHFDNDEWFTPIEGRYAIFEVISLLQKLGFSAIANSRSRNLTVEWSRTC